MSNGIYVSMAGAAARSDQLDALSDNLSNIQTPGFRATKVAFQSFLATAGVTDKIFPAAVSSGLDMKPGQLVVTENPMDVAPDGMTFMGVQTNAGMAYTRNGALQVSNGTLVSGGLPVMDVTGKPITIPPDGDPRIEPDGSVLVGDAVVGRIATFNLQGNIQRLGATLYTPGPGGSASATAEPVLAVGELEMGASPLEATIGLVSAQRSFDMSMKALETYRSLDTRAVEIGRVR